MSQLQPRHRAPAPARRTAGKRAATRTRPRYGRIASFAGAFLVTVVAIGAGVGLLPDGSGSAQAVGPSTPAPSPDTVELPFNVADASNAAPIEPSITTRTAPEQAAPPPVPADSGSGRRVVFDETDQRVWLIKENGDVARTYLVSGSVYDNLDPGTYEVYSTSRNAIGIDDSGTMEYMVRFTQGDNAAIGFHSIPVKDGQPLQTRKQLGTPLSHGCIRQAMPDAIALWDFAPVGTTVVVTA